MPEDSILLSEIAPNPLNVKDVELTEQMIKSFMTRGILKPITVRPKLDSEIFDKRIKYVVVDGDHRFKFLSEKMPNDHKLLIGSHVIIKDYKDLLSSFTDSCHENEVTKRWGAKEWFKFFYIVIQLDPEATLEKLSDISGASISTIGEYRKCWKEATEAEKELILSGELSVRQWSRLEKSEISAGGNFNLTSRSQSIEDSANVSTLKDSLHEDMAEEILDEMDDEPKKPSLLDKYRPGYQAPKITGIYIIDQATVDHLKEELEDGYLVGNITDEIISGDFIRVDVEWQIEDDKQTFEAYLRRLANERPKTPEEKEALTILLTREQYIAIHEDSEFNGKRAAWISEQIIGDKSKIVLKTYDDFAAVQEWLFAHKDDYPLTLVQLENYTTLSQEEIQDIHKSSLEVLASRRQETSKLNPREAFMSVNPLELDSFIPSIKSLISDKGDLSEDGTMLIYFHSWDDQALAKRWLSQSRDWVDNKLNFPARTFETTNVFDILIDEKSFKEFYHDVFKELQDLQFHTRKLNQISINSINKIKSAANRLGVFAEELIADLKLLKSRRRLSGGSEQHLKLCPKCLQPKWFDLNQTICGTCQYNGNHASNGGVAK